VSATVVGVEEVRRLMERGAQVVDALPPEDYRRLHIPGAINVPLEDLSPELLARLDAKRPVVTYCADNQCDLSARLAARLAFEGFEEVYEYAASLADWGAYGLPLEGAESDVARARDVAVREPPVCRPGERLAEVAGRLGEDSVCVVLDEDGVVLGRLRRADFEGHPQALAREMMHPGPSTFRPDVSITEMAHWFRKRPRSGEFIITTPDGRLFGVLYRADVEHVVRHAERASAPAHS
jgi:rhodanese-related sulfurtransferase